MLSENTGKEIVDRLDVLIKLQAQALVKEIDSKKGKIEFLDNAGLGSKLIGELLKISPNSVSVTLSKLKKINAKKK